MTQTFARIFGGIYLLIGVLGFIPAVSPPAPPDAPHLVLPQFYAYLFGVFPVNIAVNIITALVGIFGLLLGSTLSGARLYFRFIGISHVLLVILGIIPITNTFFGTAPLDGADVGLHAVTAVVAIYFGWMSKEADVATAPS